MVARFSPKLKSKLYFVLFLAIVFTKIANAQSLAINTDGSTAGLSASGKDAKRLIAEGGARLNDEIVLDAGQMIGAGELAEPVKLTAGRKRHALVTLG